MEWRKSKLWRFIRRHKPTALYCRRSDIPKGLRTPVNKPGFHSLTIEGCIVYESKNVPRGQFWRVPPEHGRILVEAERRLALLKGIQHGLNTMLKKAER